jgi:hypothetical protein
VRDIRDHGQIPANKDLRAYERTAVTLADVAGARITAAFE